MARKPRSDSAQAAIEAALAAASDLPQPPAHVRLRDEDWAFWDGIVRAKARAEWIAVELVVAAQLARCQRDIEVESKLLEAESTVIENQRGTMVANPRVAVLEQLARREMALMRSLRLTGHAAGDPRDLMKKRQLERDAGRLRDEIEDDELLAR